MATVPEANEIFPRIQFTNNAVEIGQHRRILYQTLCHLSVRHIGRKSCFSDCPSADSARLPRLGESDEMAAKRFFDLILTKPFVCVDMEAASDSRPIFDGDAISSSVREDEAYTFFREHGVFYQANSDIGKLVAILEDDGAAWEPTEFRNFLPVLESDPRLKQILDRYDTRCLPVCWVLGSNYPKHYFASTISEHEDENHKIAVYMCSAGSQLQIFARSQNVPSVGVRGANGMFEIPYKFLTAVKKLEENEVQMDDGGVLLVHPRFALGSTNGRAIGYGLPEKGYIFTTAGQNNEGDKAT